MVLFIECLVAIVLFTLIVVPMTAKDPISVISDYPPAIRKRCVELGLTKETKKRFEAKDLIRKGVAIIVLLLVATLVMIKLNHAETFLQGFGYTYIIWLSITWFDALVLDCGWFCHSKRVRIPGTEDMKEYHDYLFHITQSCLGTLIGLPACVIVGMLVMLLQ
ncbi:MAG: hypothetical protein II743_12105 [Lachnospiraceae bacterium]|nr:hypothetical protein [Lachnospiraceae bacterium]